MRVGVLYAGNSRDPNERSGTPHGVVTGLEANGVEVVVVRAALPTRAEQAVALAAGLTSGRPAVAGLLPQVRARASRGLSSPLVSRTRSYAAAVGLRGQDVDGWIQIGAGFEVHPRAPYVVYDDMTIPSARDQGFGHWSDLPGRVVAARVRSQASAYRRARSCCVESRWAADAIEQQYGVDSSRVVVVGTAAHRHARPLRDWSTPRFLFVGADWQRKNGNRVVAAFQEVRRRVPAATLDLVGGHPPVDVDGVTGHGFLRRDTPAHRELLNDLFDRATCLVVPSLFEPAGIVFTEAAAVGLPSIGGSRGGSADIIGDGGLVVEPTDTAELADAMTHLADPDVAHRTAASAATRGPMFTWSAVARHLLEQLTRDDSRSQCSS